MQSLSNLLANPINVDYPLQELQEILLAVIELLSLEENDFSWSGWEFKEEGINEINSIITLLRQKQIPSNLIVSVLFAPTGPIQEVSLSSGWGDIFLKVAERFDKVEKLIWNDKNP